MRVIHAELVEASGGNPSTSSGRVKEGPDASTYLSSKDSRSAMP